jgi:glycosyltransferase involved in cell wall biosynthesis
MNMRILVYLPVFNDESRIERAVKSVIKQTYLNWELVISDNDSTDNTLERIKPFLKDKRINCIRLETHVTPDIHFNNVNNFLSKGDNYDLVCFLASDDYWGDEHYLKNMVNVLIDNDKSKLVVPIFISIPHKDPNIAKVVTIRMPHGFYFLRIMKLFKDWSTVNLIYGLYDSSFFAEILNDKFSKLDQRNYFSDWWWAYLVLKKTSPDLCIDAEYFKDTLRLDPANKISRIDNFKMTLRFIRNFFVGKHSSLNAGNSQDYFVIYIFALCKTIKDILEAILRTFKRTLRITTRYIN